MYFAKIAGEWFPSEAISTWKCEAKSVLGNMLEYKKKQNTKQLRYMRKKVQTMRPEHLVFAMEASKCCNLICLEFFFAVIYL